MSDITPWGQKWYPLRELDDLQDRLSNLFARSFGRQPQRSNADEEALTASVWAPLVDIIEDEKEYVIRVEVPDVKKEELKLKVERGVLLITGDRKLEKETAGRRYHRVERAYGTFSRSFAVPEDADPSQVNADYKDGILNVRLAKTEESKPKSIEVKVS